MASTASQLEGNPNTTAASFVFNITRQAGDVAGGDNINFVVYNSDGSISNDFVADSGPQGTAGFPSFGGGLTTTLTLTAVADTTIEPNETFSVYIYQNNQGGNPFYTGSITLQNDDFGPPVFSTGAHLTMAENQTAAGTIVATAGTNAVTYSLTGGADAGDFSINATTGALTFNSAPDFEAPAGHGTNSNDYVVQVTATAEGTLTTAQTFDVAVTNVDDTNPVIAGGQSAFSIAENTTAVHAMTTSFVDAASTALTWSISGGADASLFTINASTGALSFVNAPDYENPTGHGGTSEDYLVTVQATDSAGLHANQAIDVTVTNVVEPPIITSNGGGGRWR